MVYFVANVHFECCLSAVRHLHKHASNTPLIYETYMHKHDNFRSNISYV